MTPRWGRRDWAVSLLPAALLAILLGAQLSADPAAGVTFSNSPFTDEGWNVMGARNFVLLGDWDAGNWALHLVQLPFTVVQAAGFAAIGVGIVQARLVSALCTIGAVALVGLVVARRLGPVAGVLAGLSLASCALILYYGRLVFIEDIVLLGLAGGVAALAWRPGTPGMLATIGAGALLGIAIGSKPLALFSVIGILAGATAGGGSRAWLVRAVVAGAVIALMGLAWLVLVGLPNAREIGFVLEIWAAQRMPEDLGELVRRVVSYPVASDSAVLLSLPLTVAGGLGLLAVAWRWRRLPEGERVLAGMAVGWLVLGLGVLLVASYRPNRYTLPYLPALAILAGFAVPVVRSWLARLPLPPVRAGLAGAAIGLLIGPGLAAYTGWALEATHRGPELQAEVGGIVSTAPAPMEGGLAPFLAMRAAVPIHVRWTSSEVNDGDLYGGAGVRWMVLTGTQYPLWADAHPDAWEGREEIGCYAWGEGRHCLLHFP